MRTTYRDAYFVDRKLHQQTGRFPIRGYGRGPGYKARKKKVRFIPPDVCIVCDRKGCHLSKHQKKSSVLLSRAANIFFADKESKESTDPESDSDSDISSNDDEEEQISKANYTVSFHVATVRSMMALGMARSNRPFLVDGAILDTESSTISTIGSDLVPAAVVASALPTEPNYEAGKRKLNGVGNIVASTIGYMDFPFYWGGILYNCGVYIVSGPSPFLLSHKDMDHFGLNYQSLRKIIERPSDGYSENAEMRGNVPWLLFANPSYFTEAQLRNMHRNLGHPTVEKHMRVIENGEYDDIPKQTRAQIQKLVQYCKACQFGKAKPRRFLFSMKDSVAGEFNNVIQVDVMKLPDGNILHVLCTETGFQQGMFLKRMTAQEAWRTLRNCWINIYAGAPDVLVHDAGSAFTAEDFKECAGELGIVLKCIPVEKLGNLQAPRAPWEVGWSQRP